MIVYRLAKKKYADDLSGRGAHLHGGRWNSAGVSAIYTSTNRSLCVLELLVHFPSIMTPIDFQMVSIEIPEEFKIASVLRNALSPNWHKKSNLTETVDIGDQFLSESEHIALKVPSAIVPQEQNVILNPNHGQFSKVVIVNKSDFNFDERLIR